MGRNAFISTTQVTKAAVDVRTGSAGSSCSLYKPAVVIKHVYWLGYRGMVHHRIGEGSDPDDAARRLQR